MDNLVIGLVVVLLLVAAWYFLSGPSYGEWAPASWGKCSAPCGGGQQTRSVTCSTDLCDPLTKPLEMQKCNEIDCVEYKGCYKDSTQRVLPNTIGTRNKDECYKAVKSLNPVPNYFGLQYRSTTNPGVAECWYGNGPYDTLGAASNCITTADPKYPGYVTGGAWSNAVYKING